jgi:hypothetical protein
MNIRRRGVRKDFRRACLCITTLTYEGGPINIHF